MDVVLRASAPREANQGEAAWEETLSSTVQPRKCQSRKNRGKKHAGFLAVWSLPKAFEPGRDTLFDKDYQSGRRHNDGDVDLDLDSDSEAPSIMGSKFLLG